MEEIFQASWSLFQHNGAAAFKWPGRSLLPPPLSAKDLPGGRTQILNVRRIPRLNHHPVQSDEDIAHESIADSDDWLNWNGDLENPNNSKDDCVADVESVIEGAKSIEDLEYPEQRDVSATSIVP